MIVAKIRYGGILILEGTDIFEISRSLMMLHISLADCQNLIYNNKNTTNDHKRSCSSLLEEVANLQNFGLDIVHQRVNSYKYSITSRRPEIKSNNA